MRRVLVARLDSAGDVLLCGPAIRAVAAAGCRVTVLAGPMGAEAARLLPGVADVLVWRCPWIDPEPPPVTAPAVEELVGELRAGAFDEAVVLTSYHQSPLPLALVLRLAGIGRVTAASADYPGALLDVRVRPDPADVPEPERQLATVAAAGYTLPDGDGGRLALRRPLPRAELPPALRGRRFAVLHPGVSVPARQWPPGAFAEAADLLAAEGLAVAVTGGPGERELTRRVAGQYGVDLGGRTGLAELAGVLGRASVLVVGNTGPAHLAAAVGTPVVSLFAPVVPARRWAPYGVPCVLMGDQHAPCRGTRARQCPVPGHPCLSSVRPGQVVEAARTLAEASA